MSMQDEPIKVEVMADMVNVTVKSYSQVEAMLKDQELALDDDFHLQAAKIWSDDNIADKHVALACQMFQVRPEEVTTAMRQRAKAVNHGLAYHVPVSYILKMSRGEL